MKIIFTGGGTGGHIFPIIAIVRELKKMSSDKLSAQPVFLYYLGPKDKFFFPYLKKEGLRVYPVISGKIRRYFTPFSFFQNLFDLLVRIPLGILQAFLKLFFLAPDVIFSKGGYGSLPVVIAGFLLRIPIILHESDSISGFANRIAGRFAVEVFASFPNTQGFPKDKVLIVGNPIREAVLKGSSQEAKVFFELTGEKPVILIIGGSQGAVRINDLVLNILPEWLKHFELIHLTGAKNIEEIQRESSLLLTQTNKKYYHPRGFLEERELSLALAGCHLVISRAGSGSIFEIAATGKPSILLPLPESAQDHQLKNAYALADAGGAIVIEKANLTPHFLLERARYLLGHPEIYKKMSISARKFARPRAARIIAEYLVAYLTRP